MRTIEITTTQNVTIEYELASFRDRFFAFFLDFWILNFSLLLLWLLWMYIFGMDSSSYFIYLVLLPIYLFYSPASEIWMNGQSLGKKAIGIKVAKLNGKQPVISDYLIRWAFRLVDIWFSSGTIAAVLVNSTLRGQRLGDMLAHTTVIKTRSSLSIGIADVLRINTRENYEPQYPQVARLNEQDMLLIKLVIERTKKYNNTAHKEALDMLVQKLKTVLDINETPKDKVGFLKTLLNDYIVLTR
jgi:uncharacterized RDD family membrane protein YckC